MKCLIRCMVFMLVGAAGYELYCGRPDVALGVLLPALLLQGVVLAIGHAELDELRRRMGR
jgi:hypothetical protein